MEIKADHYYFDKDQNLIYVHGPAIELHDRHRVSWQQLWRFTCLSTNHTSEFSKYSLEQIMTKELGRTIAPAIRLLYGATNV